MGYKDCEENYKAMKSLTIEEWNKLSKTARNKRKMINDKHPELNLLSHLGIKPRVNLDELKLSKVQTSKDSRKLEKSSKAQNQEKELFVRKIEKLTQLSQSAINLLKN